MNQSRVALVTGAAGGLGSAVAAVFSSRGYRQLMTDVSPTGDLSSADFVQGDLNDLVFAQSLADRAVERFGRIDVVVNVAAWRELLTMRTLTAESWERTLRVCLTAPALIARSAAKHMERQQNGVIINVSSIMSQVASGIAPAYVAAKGGLEALTRDMAVLYGPAGVRVLGVAPGAFDGPTGHDYGPAEKALIDYSRRMIPLGRWATAQEIAKTIAWLASDEASYVTGTTITLDGGWLANLYPRDITAQIVPSEFE